MDIKQLVTGDPKTGFYPITQDTITVIELNKSVMSLTNESSSEEIIAAFDNLESFQALIAEVRNPQNICSGILVNETPEDKRVGKYEATIIANTDAETLHVRWVENDRIIALSITNTDGTMSCIRNENNVGGGSGESDVYVFETNDDTITLEEYTALENAINSNKIILYNAGEFKYLFTITLVRDEVIMLSTVNADINNVQISKAELKIKSEAIRLVTLDQVLTKSNITPFTPNSDYEPATKKYVDDVHKVKLINVSTDSSYDVNTNTLNIGTNLLTELNNMSVGDILFAENLKLLNHNSDNVNLSIIITKLYKQQTNSIRQEFNFISHLVRESDILINGKISISNNAISSIYVNVIPNSKILTESQYSALGTSVNTDNVLYFVTPDA